MDGNPIEDDSDQNHPDIDDYTETGTQIVTGYRLVPDLQEYLKEKHPALIKEFHKVISLRLLSNMGFDFDKDENDGSMSFLGSMGTSKD